MSVRPLDGIRVVDLTHVLAGPYATHQMALMGAEVIRVERPDGADFVRVLGGTAALKAHGLGATFLTLNAGKKSVGVDMKTAAGRAVVLDLVAGADVVVENFRPGVADRLGVGFEAVRALKPDVIYASRSGFGPDGPMAGRPAYDHIIQGVSGLMAMTGEPESGPMRVGLPIADYVAGQALVSAILGALLQRARVPGEAQRLYVSMLEAITSLMGGAAVGHQTTGQLRGLEGNKAFSESPYSGRFDTGEGQIVIAANTGAQVARLCAVLGRPDLAEVTDRDIVIPALTEAFAKASAAEWEALLEAESVPCGRVMNLAEVMAHPQMAGSPCWLDLDVPETGDRVRVPGLPFRAPWQPDGADPAPTLGRDTVEVLRALGRSDDEITALRAEGAIADG